MKPTKLMTTFRGAEATVRIKDNVEKVRHPKKYRHPDLDTRIRDQRTSSEALLLRKALRSDINVPEVIDESDDTIVLEKVNGKMLKHVAEEDYMTQLGKQVARLHSIDIIHGDLTTSNAIVNEDVYLIDFGLSFTSQRIEDRAVDIHLLKQVLNTSHSGKSEKLWDAFLEGYRSYDKFNQVMNRLEEVEKRGRYK